MDFICLQEVFDKPHALALIYLLKKTYNHFVFDIGHNSAGTNLFLLNSGLMIASRFPITKVGFQPFTEKRAWQRLACYGVVTCKVS